MTQLSVWGSAGGDGGAPIKLEPPFSPTRYDYYVRCAAGANTLTVRMTASNGSNSLLMQPVFSPSLPAQSVSLTAYENEAIVAAASDGTASTAYWVRCLPHDFPSLDMKVRGPAPAAYYLVGTMYPPNSARPYAMVLNGEGVPVWYSASLGSPTDTEINDVENVVTGAISFIANRTQPPFGFEIHGLSPLSTRFASSGGASLDEHELRVLPNGHYLVINDPIEGGIDLTGLKIPLSDGGALALGKNSQITNCNLVEFDPTTGAVAWTWIGTDHLNPRLDSTVPQLASNPASGVLHDGGVVDVFHCNSIDVDPANGNLLVSARHMDSVFYVEKATGKILWKMGGSRKPGVAYVTVPDPFRRQHDARLEPGFAATCAGANGQVSMFDDQSPSPYGPAVAPARGVVYDVVIGNTDGGSVAEGGCGDAGSFDLAEGGAAVAWKHSGQYTSLIMGSLRNVPGGGRIIGWGQIYGSCWRSAGCDPGRVFTVVNDAGTEQVDFGFGGGITSYRAVAVPLGALDLDAMRRGAGIP